MKLAGQDGTSKGEQGAVDSHFSATRSVDGFPTNRAWIGPVDRRVKTSERLDGKIVFCIFYVGGAIFGIDRMCLWYSADSFIRLPCLGWVHIPRIFDASIYLRRKGGGGGGGRGGGWCGCEGGEGGEGGEWGGWGGWGGWEGPVGSGTERFTYACRVLVASEIVLLLDCLYSLAWVLLRHV